MVSDDDKPTDVENALLIAASGAIEMTEGDPLVQLATSGPLEDTTLVVVAMLVPKQAEDTILAILGVGVSMCQPAFDGIERTKPPLNS